MLCDLGTLQHNVGPDEEDKNLSRTDCDTSNCVDLIGLDCLSVCCTGMC